MQPVIDDLLVMRINVMIKTLKNAIILYVVIPFIVILISVEVLL